MALPGVKCILNILESDPNCEIDESDEIDYNINKNFFCIFASLFRSANIRSFQATKAY